MWVYSGHINYRTTLRCISPKMYIVYLSSIVHSDEQWQPELPGGVWWIRLYHQTRKVSVHALPLLVRSLTTALQYTIALGLWLVDKKLHVHVRTVWLTFARNERPGCHTRGISPSPPKICIQALVVLYDWVYAKATSKFILRPPWRPTMFDCSFWTTLYHQKVSLVICSEWQFHFSMRSETLFKPQSFLLLAKCTVAINALTVTTTGWSVLVSTWCHL